MFEIYLEALGTQSSYRHPATVLRYCMAMLALVTCLITQPFVLEYLTQSCSRFNKPSDYLESNSAPGAGCVRNSFCLY